MLDIVVGIPSYNEESSIGHVVLTIDKGLSQYFPNCEAHIVNADSGSEDATKDIFLSAATAHTRVFIDGGASPRGKGVNVRAIFEYANKHQAHAVALFDADVTSVEPIWTHYLIAPILYRDPPTDLVIPIYRRNRFEGNTTNHLMYPYVFAVYGRHVRQPIAGDIALSRRFYQQILSLPFWESTLLYGIDIFLTATCLSDGFALEQCQLSRKIHKSSFPQMMKIARDELDTLFRVFLNNQKQIAAFEERADQGLTAVDVESNPPDEEAIKQRKQEVLDRLLKRKVMIQSLFPELSDSFFNSDKLMHDLRTNLWCRLLARAYKQLADSTLLVLVACLVDLYMCRVFSYWEEIGGLSGPAIEQLNTAQARCLRSLLTQAKDPL